MKFAFLLLVFLCLSLIAALFFMHEGGRVATLRNYSVQITSTQYIYYSLEDQNELTTRMERLLACDALVTIGSAKAYFSEEGHWSGYFSFGREGKFYETDILRTEAADWLQTHSIGTACLN